MTALLVVVTFGALGLAGALLFYVLRLTREERDRSAARAAALTELIGESGPEVRGAQPRHPTRSSARRCSEATQPTPNAQHRAGCWCLSSARWSSGWRSRGSTCGTGRTWPRPRRRLPPCRSNWSRCGTSARATTLIVSGLVRNPHAGQPITGLSAVAFTFDRQGTFLTSGRVQLDFPQLGAGDESPFAISLPQSTGVGRYRVSFRTEDGVVPHVDRREPATLSSVKAQVTR